MTGLDRLRELADDVIGSVWANTSSSYCKKYGLSTSNSGGGLDDFLAAIADQIEAEQDERVTRRAEDREAAEWVREKGGIAYVKDAWNVRSNLDRKLEKEQAKVKRQQRHIEFIQSLCRERRERIEELNKTIAEMCPRLMPEGMEWPAFEDGEPVMLGDESTFNDEAMKVEGVELTSFGYILHGSYRNGSMRCATGEERGIPAKRPAPKVLDADGAEIRVGDTVWATNGHGPFEVTRIVHADRLRVICDDEESGHLNAYPESLTHRAPVLAADGRPLREGEHVWHVETGTELVVKELPKPREYQAVVVFAPPASHLTSFDPDQLTHERPDSWERLEEDAERLRQTIATEFGDYELDDGGSVQSSVIDLVRRAKALAERDA